MEYKYIDLLTAKLKQEDMWFATKNDPTFQEASSYYKLDEYGDLVDTSAKKVDAEIEDFIGDGASNANEAVDLWIAEALNDNRIAYTSMLVTKFKDKPVVDGIEAYENPVQLSESKRVVEDNEKIKVIFRKELDGGDVIAVFPELPANDDMMVCYAHVGQHSEMSLDYYNENTLPATQEEYKDLKTELENMVGYNLDVVTKLTEDFVNDNGIIIVDDEESGYTYAKILVDFFVEDKENAGEEVDKFLAKYASELSGRNKTIEGMLNYLEDWNYHTHANILEDKLKENILTESIKNEDYFDKMDKLRAKAEQKMIKKLQKAFPDGKVSNVIESKYDTDRILLTINGKRITIYFMEEKGEDGKPWFMVIKNKNRATEESYTGNIKDVIKYIKEEILIEDISKKTESYKTRLEEENTKSANVISQMFQAKDFDSDSKAGRIVMRTSDLFNALSDKGYDVQVSFDNGESTSAILLGQQGGQVMITITDENTPLKAFASGNFEVNKDNIDLLNDINEDVRAI